MSTSCISLYDTPPDPFHHRHRHRVAQHPVTGAVAHPVHGGPKIRESLQSLALAGREAADTE